MKGLGKSVRSRGHSKCKGPEVGECLACPRNGTEVHGPEGVSAGICPGKTCMKGRNKADLGTERERWGSRARTFQGSPKSPDPESAFLSDLRVSFYWIPDTSVSLRWFNWVSVVCNPVSPSWLNH